MSIKKAPNQLAESKHETFKMASTEDSISVPGKFRGESGKSYRVSFGVKALPDQSQKQDSVVKFDLIARSSFGDASDPLSFTIVTDGWQYHKQIEFTATNYFNDLIFIRTRSSDANQTSFSDVVLTQIDCANCALSKKITGSSVKPVINGFNSPMPETIFKFNRSGQVFGQVFKAETDNIFQVKLALQMNGSGGLGQYRLQIQSIDRSSGNDIVSSKVLAETYFRTFDLQNMNMQGVDYLIPFVAKIEKGKYYYLSVSNDQAAFNLLNTLAVLGSSSASSDSYAFQLGDSKRVGRINFAIYGYENETDNGRKMLYNESQENLSGGQKLYYYNFSNSPADYLDIFESNFNTGKVFYDEVSGGISSMNDLGNFYTYKFELPDASKETNISVEVSPAFLILTPYWSTDNKNWHKLENPVFAKPSIFSATIADLGSRTLYVKFVTDEQVYTPSLINLGNLSDLKVSAKY